MTLRNSSSSIFWELRTEAQKGKPLAQGHTISEWPIWAQSPNLLVLKFLHDPVLTFPNNSSLHVWWSFIQWPQNPKIAKERPIGERWGESHLAPVTHFQLASIWDFWWTFQVVICSHDWKRERYITGEQGQGWGKWGRCTNLKGAGSWSDQDHPGPASGASKAPNLSLVTGLWCSTNEYILK